MKTYYVIILFRSECATGPKTPRVDYIHPNIGSMGGGTLVTVAGASK